MRNTWLALALFAISAVAIVRLTSDINVESDGRMGTGTIFAAGALSGITIGISEPVIDGFVDAGTSNALKQGRIDHPSEWTVGKVLGTIVLLVLAIRAAIRWRRRHP